MRHLLKLPRIIARYCKNSQQRALTCAAFYLALSPGEKVLCKKYISKGSVFLKNILGEIE